MNAPQESSIEKNGIVNNIFFEEIIKEYNSQTSKKEIENNIFINSMLEIFESSFKKELNELTSTNNNKKEFKDVNLENKKFINENYKIENIFNFSINKTCFSNCKYENKKNEILITIKKFMEEKINKFKDELFDKLNLILKDGKEEKIKFKISHFNFTYYNKECLENVNLTKEKGILTTKINSKLKKRNYSESNSFKSSDLKNNLQEKNQSIQNFFKKIPKNK